MKYIAKSRVPPAYAAWCTPNDDWRPSWGALDGNTRRLLQRSLLEEQGYLCAYCLRRISHEMEALPQGTQRPRCHVDHVIPRVHQQRAETELPDEVHRSLETLGISRGELDIAYVNLVACCPNAERGENPRCGDHKGHRDLPITPLQPDCESSFGYTEEGWVGAFDGETSRAAMDAIDILKLNRPELRNQRRMALEGIVAILEDWETLPPELEREVREREIACYRNRDAQSRYQEFCTAILSMLEPAPSGRRLLLPRPEPGTA
jgi:hypothetical protein